MPSGVSTIPRAVDNETCAQGTRTVELQLPKGSCDAPADIGLNRSEHESKRQAIRQRSAWILLAALLLFAAMAAPFFRGMLYAADDLWAFHLPVRAFYADCLTRGVSFDWMPHLYSGFYLTGEGQGGVYHPLHWLLYSTLPLRTAFDLELLLPYPLLFAGMFCWLRRQVRRTDAALFGALCFTFGSFSLLHFVHPNAMAIVAHVPWCLWCVDVAITATDARKRVLAEAGLALLTTSQLLLGYPQYVWFSLLATGCFALWLARRASGGWNIRPLARVMAFLLLGVVAGAVQLLPTFDALANSTRQVAAADFANTGALHPANLAQVVAPYALQTRVFGDNTHELGCYLGAVPLVLLIWLALNAKHLPRRYRRLTIAASVFAGLSLLLCLGQAGGLYALQMKLPVVGRFRLPARYLVLVNLAVSLLAAVAFAAMTSRRRNLSRNLRPDRADTGVAGVEQSEPPAGAYAANQNYAGLIATSLVISLVIFVVWRTDRAASLPLLLVGPALIAAAAWLVSKAALGSRLAIPLLILFTAIDLGAYGLSYAIWPGAATADQAQAALNAAVPTVEGERIVVDNHGSDGPQLRAGNQAILNGAMLADGYAGLEPAGALAMNSANALRVAGVTRVASHGGNANIANLLPAADEDWLRVPSPLPRARLVSNAMQVEEEAIALTLRNYIDPETVAIVDEPLALHGEPGTATRTLDEPGHIRIDVQSPGRQLLIVSERFHPGWQVTVDGKPAEVVRTYGQYLGCVVDQATQNVEFTFAPDSLRFGKWISLVGLALIFGLTLTRWTFAGGANADKTNPRH